MYGSDPHLRWPDFAAAVVAIAQRCGDVPGGLTLGAFLGPYCMRHQSQWTGFATDDELVRRMTETDVIPSTYQGQPGSPASYTTPSACGPCRSLSLGSRPLLSGQPASEPART